MGDLMLVMNDDGVFEQYDDSLDVTVHFKTKEERDAFMHSTLTRWVTDRDPNVDEVIAAGELGFIICISGRIGNRIYSHAIDMTDNYYEDGRFYLHGAHPNKTVDAQGVEHDVFTVHGWMLPPVWDGEEV